MKRAVLSVAALLFGAVLFAQGETNPFLNNETTIDQSGHGHDATVEQDGIVSTNGNDEHWSLITQSGQFSTAEVLQMGGHNGSRIVQKGLSHTANVEQEGSNLDSYIEQVGGASNGKEADYQSEFLDGGYVAGGYNNAEVLQEGVNSDSHIVQVGEHNEAKVWQYNIRGEGPISTISQTGTGHSADVDQHFNPHTSIVIQKGGNTGDDSSGHTVEVDQYGVNNYSMIFQDGVNHFADVWQHGEQDGTNITQTGSSHSAVVTQGNSGVLE